RDDAGLNQIRAGRKVELAAARERHRDGALTKWKRTPEPHGFLPSDVEECEVVELAVRLALDVDKLDQRDDRPDVAELPVGQRALEAGEVERGALMDVGRDVVGVEE